MSSSSDDDETIVKVLAKSETKNNEIAYYILSNIMNLPTTILSGNKGIKNIPNLVTRTSP